MPSAKPSPKSKTIAKVKKTVSTNQRAEESEEQARLLKKPEYKSFRLSKRIKHPKPRITGSFKIFSMSLKTLWKGKRVFAGILAIYLLLNFVFVKGFGESGAGLDLKDLLDQLFNSNSGKIISAVTIFSVLVGSSGGGQSDAAGVFNVVLILIMSLAIIWSLRQILAGKKISIRDGFYNGMGPIIKYLVVLFIVGFQTIPVAVGYFLFNALFSSGLAANGLEQVLWGILVFMLILWSLYMITSSMFALYIVTLSNMTPLKSLRSARELVRYRRWTVLRRVIFLPFAMLILLVGLMIPIILIRVNLAELSFFTLSLSVLFFVHAYYYTLYRELIK